jgi:hypothetical protein
MTEGIDCEVVEIASADLKEVRAINALAHHQSMNCYEETGIDSMIQTAEEYRVNSQSGGWADAQKDLEAVLGEGKRMFVYRCCVAAQTLSPAVV